MNQYEIETTDVFDTWLDSLDDVTAYRITSRTFRVELGNFGDAKSLGESLYELRFHFGAGYRVYYSIQDGKVVLLLAGGIKRSQKKDIKKARELLADLE